MLLTLRNFAPLRDKVTPHGALPLFIANLCTHFISEVKGRLEEAKANSPGQSDAGVAPWVGIRPEWYALNGQKPHTKKITSLIPVLFAFAHSGRKPCGLCTQGAAPSSLCPGLVAGWPFRPPELRCVQRLAINRGRVPAEYSHICKKTEYNYCSE